MNKDSREYETRNKEARRLRDRRRAEADPKARTAFDLKTKQALFAKQSGNCPCCFLHIGQPMDGEVDHIIPLSRGGKHHPSNFMLTHRQCNKEKHNKTLSEHWEWRVTKGLDPENLGRKHGLVPGD